MVYSTPPPLWLLLDRKGELRKSAFRRSLCELAPQLTPPWPPAVVFLIEARCGPDALGGSWGEAGTVGGQHSRPVLPPHCIQPQSQTQAPSQRPVELPTLFPDLLAKAPPGGSSRGPLASSHTSSTSASLTDHLCGVLGRRRRGGKRGWGWGRRQAGRRPLQRGKKKENTQKVGPG